MSANRNGIHQQPRLLLLGGTGRIAQPFVRTFIQEGVQLRILARSPKEVQSRYPQAEVLSGNMLNVGDVRRAMEGLDGAFLITPIGNRSQVEIELVAARAAIEAGLETHLPHLIFVSVVHIDRPTGVPLLDVKRQIECLLAQSGLPWTSLRAGSYMEDVIDQRLRWIRRGLWLFPVPPHRPISFTAQPDIARSAVCLLRERRSLNRAMDVVEPVIRTPGEVARMVGARLGKTVWVGGTPLLRLMQLLCPLISMMQPKLLTIFDLCRYLNREGLPGQANQVAALLPGFQATGLDRHLDRLFR